MAKVRNLSDIQQEIAFTEFDFYQRYEESFKKSELGRIKSLLPLREMAISFGLVEEKQKSLRTKRGRKSFFTPEGKVALAFLKMYTGLAALYSRADVVTSFSSAETFGLTVIESYACGTLVVVYDNSAHPFLVAEDTGYVVPNGSNKAAYQAIQQIRQKGKIHYSKSCRKFVLDRYDKDIVYKQYVDMYEDILNKS